MKFSNDLRDLADIVHYLSISEHERCFVDKCQKLFSALESIWGLYTYLKFLQKDLYLFIVS